MPLAVGGVLGGATSMVAFGALLSLAGANAPASGNAERVRADLRGLSNRLAVVIKRMEHQQRKVGLARVRVDAAGLLRTMRQLEAAELRAVDQFPRVFGVPYAETFTPLTCVARQLALSQHVLREFARGRLESGRENPNLYPFRFVLGELITAKRCNEALKRKMRINSVAGASSSDLRGMSKKLAVVIKRMEDEQRTVGPARLRVDAAGLRRTMKELEAVEQHAVRQFPPVFGLRYAVAFTSLSCVDRQVAVDERVLREFAQGRFKSGRGNPNLYPFTFVLGHLANAKQCVKTLESALRRATAKQTPVTTTTTLTTTTTQTSTSPSAQAAAPLPMYMNTKYSFEERAADLVSRMTLAEKVEQLRTNVAPAIPRLSVQQYTYWSEGQHGISRLGADTNPGNASGGVHATSFPTNFAATMSWDPGLMYSETTAISDEARGFLDKSLWDVAQNNLGPAPSDYGSLTFWAPTVNMDRDPRWGRADEAFGEDPYLVSRMAGAFVDGYQGETLGGLPQTPYLKVAATAKHYALNNVEQDRQAVSSRTNDTDLHDYYTAPFRSLIEDSHVSGLMTSLNAIDGTPAMADTYTDNQVAQRTYGFGGYSTSDCALGNIYRTSPNGHNWAPPGWTTDGQDTNATWTSPSTGAKVSGAAGAQAFALRAGTYLNCTGGQATLSNVERAIGAGILSEGVIDSALVRIFTTRMRTGEFDPPSAVSYTTIKRNVIQSAAHQALAEQVAANSLVLLKNDDVSGTTAPLLPASAAKLNKVVIVGDLANKVTLGGYSGAPSLRVSAVQGITAALKAANPNATVVFDAAATSTTATTPAVLSAQTQADIRSADLVIVFVGTDASVAAEEHPRDAGQLHVADRPGRGAGQPADGAGDPVRRSDRDRR